MPSFMPIGPKLLAHEGDTQTNHLVLMLKKMKIGICPLLIPDGNSYCRRKSSARGPWFKVSSERLSTEIDILIRSPIQVQTKADIDID